MVTISTIAKKCGVSKSTVSRVLSNNENVSKETREKIMQVIKETNYKPNRYAQILNNKASNLIGIIVPDITNPYFPEIIQQIEYIATTNNYKIILCNTNTKAKSEYEYLETLEDMRVDGTILISPSTSVNDLSHFERQSILSVDAVIGLEHPYVASDFFKGGYLAGTKLIENGCKNILHITGHSNFYANIERRNGFEKAIKTSTEDIKNFNLLSDLSISKGYDNIKKYLSSHPDVDGIFADNDSIAFTVLRILKELNISVPEQVKIIGYDDNYMIPMVYPLLSTIHQPIKEIGTIAAETIINMINNKQIKYNNIIDVEYIQRETTII